MHVDDRTDSIRDLYKLIIDMDASEERAQKSAKKT